MLRERTKEMFAQTLMLLAKKKAIREIQVKEICSTCGAERTTFYYHFHDKYELVAWIFKQQYLDEEKQSPFPNTEEMICRMFYRMKEERAFFVNALQDPAQNNLCQYMLDFYISSEEAILRKYLGVDTLDEEMEYAIRQYSFGCMGHTVEWLLGKNDLSPEKMAYYQYKFMPDFLKEAFCQAGGREEEPVKEVF